jgi:hypothetical protein
LKSQPPKAHKTVNRIMSQTSARSKEPPLSWSAGSAGCFARRVRPPGLRRAFRRCRCRVSICRRHRWMRHGSPLGSPAIQQAPSLDNGTHALTSRDRSYGQSIPALLASEQRLCGLKHRHAYTIPSKRAVWLIREALLPRLFPSVLPASLAKPACYEEVQWLRLDHPEGRLLEASDWSIR